MEPNTITAADKTYPVHIVREHRRTVSASIRKKGVVIRVPLFLDRNEEAQHIFKMKMWAQQKLLEEPEFLKETPAKTYSHGDHLTIGDESYLLDISFRNNTDSCGLIKDNTIVLTVSANLPPETQQKHISTLLSRCIARKRIPQLREKIHALNQEHFSQPLKKIFFKNTSSRWGSCSSKGNINISTRLLFAPTDVLEYVCIHELAHLIEHNHSENFWKLVENAMPDYRKKIQWLKEYGKNCVF